MPPVSQIATCRCEGNARLTVKKPPFNKGSCTACPQPITIPNTNQLENLQPSTYLVGATIRELAESPRRDDRPASTVSSR